MQPTTVYALLGLAIVTEVTATLMLEASNGWERWGLGLGSIAMYAVAAYVLGHVLQHMNVGLAYTVWSGAGIALVCIATVTIFGQHLDAWALAGIALIFIGTLLISMPRKVRQAVGNESTPRYRYFQAPPTRTYGSSIRYESLVRSRNGRHRLSISGA